MTRRTGSAANCRYLYAMQTTTLPEVWLRGPLPGLSPYLQPVAHALLQAKEEVSSLLENFPPSLLWERPGGVASVGFHLQHLCGVLDRLFTYVSGNLLSQEQMEFLRKEGKPAEETRSVKDLVNAFNDQIAHFLEGLNALDETSLNDGRGVGRAQLPSTVIGLLFHAAEHTMRHAGQLLVTVQWLKTVSPHAFTQPQPTDKGFSAPTNQ